MLAPLSSVIWCEGEENLSLTEVEVEAAVAQAPGVSVLAVVAQPDPARDQAPVT